MDTLLERCAELRKQIAVMLQEEEARIKKLEAQSAKIRAQIEAKKE